MESAAASSHFLMQKLLEASESLADLFGLAQIRHGVGDGGRRTSSK
jgi:hypothetical protein